MLVLTLALVETAGAAGSWRDLHRPLHLPELAAGEACPVSSVDERIDWDSANIFGGSGIGRGPAYPGLGGADPVGHFHAPTRMDGMFGEKLFWYVRPSHRGRVLVRGRQLDGGGVVGWLKRRKGVVHQLRIKPGQTVTWRGQPPGSRGVPTGTFVSGSGCYAVQIDGARFSRTIVFTASTHGAIRSGLPQALIRPLRRASRCLPRPRV